MREGLVELTQNDFIHEMSSSTGRAGGATWIPFVAIGLKLQRNLSP